MTNTQKAKKSLKTEQERIEQELQQLLEATPSKTANTTAAATAAQQRRDFKANRDGQKPA
jgi:hypothetical protein